MSELASFLRSRKGLGVLLSKLKVFEKPKANLEQYPTDSEVASYVIWEALLNNDLDGKVIADLGCGTGILGIAGLLYNAKMVYFVDIDLEALKILKQNIESLEKQYNIDFSGQYKLINQKVSEFNEKVDVVIENPPFGVQKEHADREFLIKSMQIAPTIYSMHKIESKAFIDQLAKDNEFIVNRTYEYNFPLKQTLAFHKKRIYRVHIGCFRIIKAKK